MKIIVISIPFFLSRYYWILDSMKQECGWIKNPPTITFITLDSNNLTLNTFCAILVINKNECICSMWNYTNGGKNQKIVFQAQRIMNKIQNETKIWVKIQSEWKMLFLLWWDATHKHHQNNYLQKAKCWPKTTNLLKNK